MILCLLGNRRLCAPGMLLMGQSIASDTLVSRNAFYSFWRDAGFPVDFEFKHYHIWNEPVFSGILLPLLKEMSPNASDKSANSSLARFMHECAVYSFRHLIVHVAFGIIGVQNTDHCVS